MFPDHAASQEISDPVFVGGPVHAGVIFALVARDKSPGGGSIEIMPGLFAALDGRTVDRIIEADAADARYITGLVLWRPGELRREIEQDAWYVLKSDSGVALRDPEGLWEELSRRAYARRYSTALTHPREQPARGRAHRCNLTD